MNRMTAAPTSTITAAPTKELDMYAVQNTPAQTVAELVEARGGRYERIGEYVDTTPPEYDDMSAYAMSLIDIAVEGRATGELSPEGFDEAFAAALRFDRAPVIQAATPWPFSEADQLALEEIQEEIRPKPYSPPVNGFTEIDRLSIAAARRQEADAEYAVMLAEQERMDDIEALGRMDFSHVTPVVPEYDFSDLYTLEVAA
ncbi:hypothetical protein [Sanguibacter sp. Leaf3]|uniref:hypothetical protein n=1 Tax=Sanguibacter sp. Leaf3 TaxID=1736209 RepID=UPI0006FA8A48|nr:hypothetical protein [Sanguibacter sp. Leaf3]KQT98392.1 hypothetical protein ASG53_12080 [Sanguibacter sp. Leaf3]